MIVTPIKAAPIAQAHLLLRVEIEHGRPIPRDVHAGGFIEMHPEVITEVAMPIRHRDALHRLEGHGVGLVLTESAAVLRPRDMYVAGTGQAEESLRALIGQWDGAGRPDHAPLQPILLPSAAGFCVEVHIQST